MAAIALQSEKRMARRRSSVPDENPHWMRVIIESLHELGHSNVDDCVSHDFLTPKLVLNFVRKLSVDEQVSNFQKVGLFGKLLDGISTVSVNPSMLYRIPYVLYRRIPSSPSIYVIADCATAVFWYPESNTLNG